jgi:hypothetical protein
MDFLTLVMAAPVHKAVSAIQLEAYKRYILVSMIAFGQVNHTLPDSLSLSFLTNTHAHKMLGMPVAQICHTYYRKDMQETTRRLL